MTPKKLPEVEAKETPPKEPSARSTAGKPKTYEVGWDEQCLAWRKEILGPQRRGPIEFSAPPQVDPSLDPDAPIRCEFSNEWVTISHITMALWSPFVFQAFSILGYRCAFPHQLFAHTQKLDEQFHNAIASLGQSGSCSIAHSIPIQKNTTDYLVRYLCLLVFWPRKTWLPKSERIGSCLQQRRCRRTEPAAEDPLSTDPRLSVLMNDNVAYSKEGSNMGKPRWL